MVNVYHFSTQRLTALSYCRNCFIKFNLDFWQTFILKIYADRSSRIWNTYEFINFSIAIYDWFLHRTVSAYRFQSFFLCCQIDFTYFTDYYHHFKTYISFDRIFFFSKYNNKIMWQTKEFINFSHTTVDITVQLMDSVY